MLNGQGYRRKTYDEILTEVENKARELFGENVKLGHKSVIGIILMIMAWFLSLVWQDNEDVYYSGYVGTATDKNLDRLLPNSGIRRNLATYATGYITITGTANATIPQGFLVSTENEVLFETMEEVKLDASGTGTVQVYAIETGSSGNIAANALTVIVNPDANVDAITNIAATSGGRERETDLEVRDRYYQTIEGLGATTLPSIRSELLKLPNVRAATVTENDTGVTDVNGYPPHSIVAYVLGGDDQDVAETIFRNKTGGIRPFGDIEKTVFDDGGQPKRIAFFRAQELTIFLKLSILKNNLFPTDGEIQVKNTLVRHIGGEDADGALYAGLSMGEDVVYSRLISQVFKVPGVEDVSLSISTDGINFFETNISVENNQVAQTQFTDIEVTNIV